MQKQVAAYVRVSTARQGERGVSLQEQRAAITHYAGRFELQITEWFEERESAARRGRPVFLKMLKLLRKGTVSGVVIHKIDRSARNLRDWADLGELIDSGIDVYFANESLDLNTRGGRLSADIQAVVAADYVRNLREETKKGFYGRLKQGLYPLPAPAGYLDRGKGKAKELDPVRAPLIADAFKLYSTGQYSLPRLIEEMDARHLSNRDGGKVTLNGLSTILNNPFYAGLVRIRTTGEMFQGVHEPLVSKALFDRVQDILHGKTVVRRVQHDFIYRRMLQCRECGYSVIGEKQKGHVYYRCHSAQCPTTSVREETVDAALKPILQGLTFTSGELSYANTWVSRAQSNLNDVCAREIQSCTLQLQQTVERLHRLTDGFLDATIDKSLFQERRNQLVEEQATLKGRIAQLQDPKAGPAVLVQKFLELVKSPVNAYERAIPEEKRALLKKLTSNRIAHEKNVEITLSPAVQILLERSKSSDGRPSRGVHRTLEEVLQRLLAYFASADTDGTSAAALHLQ